MTMKFGQRAINTKLAQIDQNGSDRPFQKSSWLEPNGTVISIKVDDRAIELFGRSSITVTFILDRPH